MYLIISSWSYALYKYTSSNEGSQVDEGVNLRGIPDTSPKIRSLLIVPCNLDSNLYKECVLSTSKAMTNYTKFIF